MVEKLSKRILNWQQLLQRWSKNCASVPAKA